jgi:hypothetical protein
VSKRAWNLSMRPHNARTHTERSAQKGSTLTTAVACGDSAIPTRAWPCTAHRRTHRFALPPHPLDGVCVLVVTTRKAVQVLHRGAHA